MVEVKEFRPSEKSITSHAIESKEPTMKIRLRGTRKSCELNQQRNCKITTEVKLTKAQKELYNQIIEDDREKTERKKKKKKGPEIIEIGIAVTKK